MNAGLGTMKSSILGTTKTQISRAACLTTSRIAAVNWSTKSRSIHTLQGGCSLTKNANDTHMWHVTKCLHAVLSPSALKVLDSLEELL